jgi:glyoxylate reductase
MKKKRVYITRMIPRENIDDLKKCCDVEVNPDDRALTPAELMEKVKGRDGVLTLLTDKVDAAVMDAAGPQCKIFANYAVGFNNFDLEAATARGIILTNTPGVLDDATATHTWTLLLSTARRIAEADKFVRDGKWKGWAPMFFIGLDIDRKTLGIAGMGRIGSNVAKKARAST